MLVDLDGVLADLEGAFFERWQKRFPNRKQLTRDTRRHRKIADDFPAEYRADVQAVFEEEGFYRHLPQISGAIEGFAGLVEAVPDTWLCTSPLRAYRNCVLEKYEWVDKHLGPDWTERLILTHNKTLVTADVLIDDNPDAAESGLASWELILFDSPYNRSQTHLRRLSWQTWREVLLTPSAQTVTVAQPGRLPERLVGKDRSSLRTSG